MSRLHAALIAAYCLSMFSQQASAQPRGGASERERVGILGRAGARRDERLNRNAPAPAAANPNAAMNPNLAPNARGAANPAALNQLNSPGANPLLFGRTAPGAASGRGPGTPNTQAPTFPNNSPYANRGPTGAPTPAPVPQAGAQAAGQRSAYYPPGSTTPRNAGGASPYSVAGTQQSTDANTVPPAPANVRPASATAPVNKLPYNGPGVLVRLPRTIAGEVNYLVDDSEHLIVHSGEDQLLRLKGSYEVRFSRGVTSEGRSYGEARYTITEGVYRFDVSANGWELYREGEAGDVEKAIAEAQKRADELQREESLTADKPRDESSNSLPPLLAPRDTRPAANSDKKQDDKSSTTPPTPVPPAEEESLPAPKSILEPT